MPRRVLFPTPEPEKMAIRWPVIDHPNTKWLTDEEQVKLLLEAEGWEAVVLHFGLDYMMRRGEMMNATYEDFLPNMVRIRGKGKGGGKVRTVARHDDTDKILQLASEISGQRTGPILVEMWPWRGRPAGRPMELTSVDRILERLSKRTGIKTSYHPLRRTGGRNLWRLKVDIVAISEIMGHEDIRTTKKYLGINLNDMNEAFKIQSAWKRALLVEVSRR
jgi:integrase